jgi:sec-independent protein translocase protein TatB
MFGISFSELFVILVVVLIVVKPEDLPKFFRGLGRIYGQLKRFSLEFMRHLNTLDS